MGLLPELRATDVIFLHCPTCAFQTHFLSRLGEHFEQSHSGSVEFRLYRCPVCQRVASSLPFMREHLDVMHEVETGTDIAVYFSGNLYSQQKEEEGAKEERSCAFCAFKAADADLAEHYGIVHGVANVFFDRVCDDPAPASLLEAKAESGDEMMESDEAPDASDLPCVKSEVISKPDGSPPLPALPKVDPLTSLSFTSAQLSAAYHLAHSAALSSGAAVSFNSVIQQPVTLNSLASSSSSPSKPPKSADVAPHDRDSVNMTSSGLGSGSSAGGSDASRTPDPSITIPSPSTLVDSFSAVINPSNRMIPRVTLSERAKNVLFQWLLTHLNEPYPSEEDKGRLASMAGVNRTTVSNWFINARRRYIRPMKEGRLPPNNDFVRRVQRYTSFIQQQQRSLSSAGNLKSECQM